MDRGITRRAILKGMVVSAGLPYLSKGEESVNRSEDDLRAAPPTTSRPATDLLVVPSGWPAPVPSPSTPGLDYDPPVKVSTPAADAPVVYEHTPEAGPDQTFFLAGDHLTSELFVWGGSQDQALGQQWQAKIQFAHEHGLTATLPQIAEDGPFLVWAGNANGWSRPLRLNIPQPWWCGPDVISPGETVRVFGRDLARRPECLVAFVYIALSGQPGLWLSAEQTSKYSVTVRVPKEIKSGAYQLWVHAGRGGQFGWGGPISLNVHAGHKKISSVPQRIAPPSAGQTVDIQRLLDQQLQTAGGTVLLGEGIFPFHQTLRVPAGVTLIGSGRDKTRLQLVNDEVPRLDPREDAAAVWLAGDGAGLTHLTVSGTSKVNLGVTVKSPEPLVWVKGCRIEDVRIVGVARKRSASDKFLDNYGVRLTNAAYAVVQGNEICARAPIFLSGVRQCHFIGNDLLPLTMWGGNAEASILGRNEVIEECIIEGNRVASPAGAGAGGPTTRRLIWLSTGHGSVTHNWIAGNGVGAAAGPGAPIGADQPRFGGVAGTEQNVGETILLEANLRTMFFGKLAGGDLRSVVLPKTLPPTPDDRLGAMLNRHGAACRELLAHDAAGRETPYWPPDRDIGGEEPPIYEYYVSVFSGKGQGQTRRVIRREGNRLIVDRPWKEPPANGSLVAIGTAFYQNLIIGNYVPDGMSGIQLWISCVENVVADNTIARQRREGIYFFTSASTLASSMPRSWNHGIAPLFWNVAESNRAEECSTGALVASGNNPPLPVEFPRALGNVLRHNSLVRSRDDGVALSARGSKSPPGVQNTAPAVAGTVVEFNLVRDATTGYHSASGNDDAVFRRNHAYFWYPVSNSSRLPVAFQVDTPNATVVIEANNAENKTGNEGVDLIRLKKAEKSIGGIRWTQE